MTSPTPRTSQWSKIRRTWLRATFHRCPPIPKDTPRTFWECPECGQWWAWKDFDNWDGTYGTDWARLP